MRQVLSEKIRLTESFRRTKYAYVKRKEVDKYKETLNCERRNHLIPKETSNFQTHF